jgi:NADH-quinone oxidoreductase subunit F
MDLLNSIGTQMRGTTICMLSDSCAMPVHSFLAKFEDEFLHFIEHGKSMIEDPIRL